MLQQVASHRFLDRVHSKLREDALNVRPHRRIADVQQLRNLLLGQVIRQQGEDLFLSSGELNELLSAEKALRELSDAFGTPQLKRPLAIFLPCKQTIAHKLEVSLGTTKVSSPAPSGKTAGPSRYALPLKRTTFRSFCAPGANSG